MKAKILVSFKDSVLDPQGQTVKNALHTLGYKSVVDVRQGKFFDIELQGLKSTKEAEAVLREIADKVLANPIIEKFAWLPLEGGPRKPAPAGSAKAREAVRRPARKRAPGAPARTAGKKAGAAKRGKR